jgi:cytoskeletal protein RodZ
MPGFGERLKAERESRNTTLEEMSEKTGIGPGYLRALENEDFRELPGRAFGKLYIRAYAEVLGFDPEDLLAEYDREAQNHEVGEPPRVRRPAKEKSPPPEPPAEAKPEEPPRQKPVVSPPKTPVQPPAVARRPERTAIAAGALIAAAVFVAAMLYLSFCRADGVETEYLSGDPTSAVSSAGTTPRPSETGQAEPETVPEEDPAPPSVQETKEAVSTSPGSLTVSEFGVGRRIVDRRLVDRGDRFEQGSVAWFQTRVLGGRRGESIRHVWLHEGRAVESVDLRLGGPHWRTHSRKTVRALGDWAVEARDSDGRLLARATFTCVPAGR